MLHARCGASCMPGAARPARRGARRVPYARYGASCMPDMVVYSVLNSVRNLFTQCVMDLLSPYSLRTFLRDAVRTVARIFPNKARCEKPYSLRNSFSLLSA